MKLMMLKIQGPSLARAMEGTKINILFRTELCIRNLVFFIKSVPKLNMFEAPQNLDLSLHKT